MGYRKYFVATVGNGKETWKFRVTINEVMFNQPYVLVAKLLEKYTPVSETWIFLSLKEIDDVGTEIDKYERDDGDRFVKTLIDSASAETIAEFSMMGNMKNNIEVLYKPIAAKTKYDEESEDEWVNSNEGSVD